MYGSENWVLQKKHDREIEALELKHLRKITGETKWNRLRNKRIREIIGQKSMLTKRRKDC